MRAADGRPIYLDLFKIRLPITGVISIAHRISGVLLFLAIPASAYLLDLSLRGPEGYEAAAALLGAWWLAPAYLVLAWSVAHHLLAGIRYLLIDLHIGVERLPATRSAWVVATGGAMLGLVVALGVVL